MRKTKQYTDEDLFSLKPGKLWGYFKSESFAFWMICAYLFFEYVRPQSIVPAIDILPWTQLAIIGAFLGCFVDKSVRWVSSPVNVLLLLYLFIILISSINAYFPGVSYENLSNYYLWVIIYFLIINIVNTRRRFFIFLCIFLLASFKISLSLAISWAQRGFSFTSWGLSGPPGFFQNSGELAIQMLVFWPIALAFAVALKPYVSRWWYRALLMMPVTAIMVILGSSSRGGQLALVVQLAVMNYRSIFRPKVLMTIGVSLFLVWQLLPEEQKERFEGMGEDRTSQQRILYFENGVDMIKDHPFLGVGFFNFRQYFDLYYPEDALFGRAELPHNIFIQVGTDAGLIGLFIFSLLVFYSLKIPRSIDTCNDYERRVGLAKYGNISVFGFLVAGQFVTVAYYPYFWIHLSLLVAMKNSFSK